MVSTIVLIGFQCVGKTTLGRALAAELQIQFKDLDEEIVKYYEINRGQHLSCRRIAQVHGEEYFRTIESTLLKEVIESSSDLTLSLGGGTPISSYNQSLIRKQLVVHITANQEIVFQRIKEIGWPSYFNPDESPYMNFKRLWVERDVIYRQLSPHTINNNGSISDALELLKRALPL